MWDHPLEHGKPTIATLSKINNHPCNRLSFGPPTSSQILTWNLLISYECLAISYTCPFSSYNLTCFFSSTFCPRTFYLFFSFCISYFYCFLCLAGGSRPVPLFFLLWSFFASLDSSSFPCPTGLSMPLLPSYWN